MKQITCLIFLIPSLLYTEVVSDDSFLQMKNLEIYTVNFMNIFKAKNTTTKLDQSNSIQSFFNSLNNFTNYLETLNVNLRSDKKEIGFFSDKQLPGLIRADLKDILDTAKGINDFFQLYLIDFLDGFSTVHDIQTFIRHASYPGSLYQLTAKLKNALFPVTLMKAKANIFDEISNKVNSYNHFCATHSTRQQFLISVYSYIIKTQFKAFLMLSSAKKLNSIITTSTPSVTRGIGLERTYFLSKSSHVLKNVQRTLPKISTSYHNCRTNYSTAYKIENITAIDLSSTVIGYRWNKVVTGVQFELHNGTLSLALTDGTLLENGKISTQNWDSRKHYSINRGPEDYYFEEIIEKPNVTSNIEYIDPYFWKKISFLHTTVPENHVIVGANFEILKFNPKNAAAKKVLYIRLHCAPVNITTGQIDTDNIVYTKVWTKDDPELKTHPEVNENHSFISNREAVYDQILVDENDMTIAKRWRRKPSLRSYIDSNVISVNPTLAITSIGFWKNNHTKNVHCLSLNITTNDISSLVNPEGSLYVSRYFVQAR